MCCRFASDLVWPTGLNTLRRQGGGGNFLHTITQPQLDKLGFRPRYIPGRLSVGEDDFVETAGNATDQTAKSVDQRIVKREPEGCNFLLETMGL